MGASQSTESATERQLKEVGPFALRSSEKGAIKILSRIVQKLLTKNNLFNLEEMLSSQERCKDLFIVVSSTVKKEFQLLKFPDPRNPSHMATLSFLPKADYPPKYPESIAARDRACNEITHFLIRLVTLAAACTASISRNENIASLLDIASSPVSDSIGKKVRDLPDSFTFVNTPIDKAVIEYLSPKFNLVHEGHRPNLYRFGNAYTYIVDVKRGIIYMGISPDNKTPVFKISMKMLMAERGLKNAPTAASAPQQYLPVGLLGYTAPAGAPQAAAAPAPVAAPPAATAAVAAPPDPSVITNSRPNYQVNPGSIATSVLSGGRKTRGRRMKKRHTRRRTYHRGGERQPYVECVIEEIPLGEYSRCESTSCKRTQFVIDSEGNTYDWNLYLEFQGNLTKMMRPDSILSFDDRVRLLFEEIVSQRIMTTEYRESTELSKDRYKPISGATEETFKTLKDYSDTMTQLPTGSSPAPYRAFLLASRLSGADLTTLFCKDEWAGQFTTATMAYSLLQALYDDGVAGTMPSPRSLDACKAMAKLFTGAEVAVPAAQTGSEVENFHNIRFAPIPNSLDAYCKTRAPQTTSSTDDKSLLIATQRDLRKLYDAHIAAMVGIMKKVMFITSDPSEPGSMIINLNESFSTDPAGGLVALERIISEARTIIGSHYLAVEKKYAGALLQMGRFRRGVTAVNNPVIALNALKEVSSELATE